MTKITIDLSPILAQHLAEVQTQLTTALGSPATLEDALNSIIMNHRILNGGAAALGLTLPEMIEDLIHGALVVSAGSCTGGK